MSARAAEPTRRPRLARSGWVGVAIISVVLALAILAPILSPTPPERIDLAAAWLPPGPGHPLGTADNGVDVLAQLTYGARVSLAVGLGAVVLSGLLGTLLGTLAGYVEGLWDEIVMWIANILLAFPGLLLAIFLASVLGPSVRGLLIAICATSWVSYARLARAQMLALRRRDFVIAAQALGASPMRIVYRHVLPNILAPLLVQATFGLPGAILAEAALSFLGLGVPPGTPSWGALVDQGTAHLLDAPHVVLFPGAAIAIAVLAFNLLGDALQAQLNAHGT